MNLDDEICYCFHVPMRKLINFARQRDLKRPSQMSECLNAGTGCGWCIPILTMIFERTREARVVELGISPEAYAAKRDAYREEQRPRHTFETPPPPRLTQDGPSP